MRGQTERYASVDLPNDNFILSSDSEFPRTAWPTTTRSTFREICNCGLVEATDRFWSYRDNFNPFTGRQEQQQHNDGSVSEKLPTTLFLKIDVSEMMVFCSV